MSSSDEIIELERATERLRQERETFEQNKKQDSLWFVLRLSMGFAAVVLLVAVLLFSLYVLVNWHDFPNRMQTVAQAAIFGDMLGLFVGIWKVVIAPKTTTRLEPITNLSSNGRRKRAEVSQAGGAQ